MSSVLIQIFVHQFIIQIDEDCSLRAILTLFCYTVKDKFF